MGTVTSLCVIWLKFCISHIYKGHVRRHMSELESEVEFCHQGALFQIQFCCHIFATDLSFLVNSSAVYIYYAPYISHLLYHVPEKNLQYFVHKFHETHCISRVITDITRLAVNALPWRPCSTTGQLFT